MTTGARGERAALDATATADTRADSRADTGADTPADACADAPADAPAGAAAASGTTALAALRETVKARYGAAAQRVNEGTVTSGASCCGPAEGSSACCGATTDSWDPITSNLYDAGQAAGVPSEALLASLGCGNPTALADLEAGDVVLDLGSGGGIDVLLSAKRVGPTGKAYGLDMTDEMLALANANKARAGATNVEFLRGHIEQIPLPSNTVDVIISNCVVNLSGDKRAVLAESFRVLRPGGRFAVSDVVVRGTVPPAVKRNMELWVGCVAGALEEQEFLTLLSEVGFVDASVEPTRVYKAEDASAFLAGSGLDIDQFVRDVDGKFMGAFIRATKPGVREPRVVHTTETATATATASATAISVATVTAAVTDAPAPTVTATAPEKSCCGPDCCS